MAPASVAEITEAEVPEVAGFLARQVPADEAVVRCPLPPADRLRWLLLDNPSRAADIPFGWRIRDAAGAVSGAAICTPFRISSAGVVFTALMFSKFYVDSPIRGMGLGLLMRFVRLGQRFPLFCTSTNAIAGALFEKLGAKQISGLDHTMLGIARPRPLAEEWIYRRTHSPRAARILSAPARFAPSRMQNDATALERSGGVTPISSMAQLAAYDFPVHEDVTAVVRDRDYFRWRYFSGERDKDVYRFRHPGEVDRLVIVNQLLAGYRRQIRVLNVLDVWPPTTVASAPALCIALSLRYAGQFDAIWLRSQPSASEAALSAAGFVRHDFPAPLGWFIDSQNRLPAKNWYVMPGESE